MMKVLIKPIITEKATRGSEVSNSYTFSVDPRANKLEIKAAVEETYNVTVAKVRTLNYGPVRKVKYTKTGVQSGKTNATKRAIVQVAEGDAIDFYSNL
jgi:large subunit ribosomal protein L23